MIRNARRRLAALAIVARGPIRRDRPFRTGMCARRASEPIRAVTARGSSRSLQGPVLEFRRSQLGTPTMEMRVVARSRTTRRLAVLALLHGQVSRVATALVALKHATPQ